MMQTTVSWRRMLLLIMMVALGAVACRVNELPTYLPRVETTHVVQVIPSGPSMRVGASRQDNGVAALVTELATAKSSIDAYSKMEASADPVELSGALHGAMTQQLESALAIKNIPDKQQAHDTRLEVTIIDYGMRASSPESEIFYFFQVDARMIYVPENKLIWEFDDTLNYPLKEFHVYSGAGVVQAFNAAANIGALNDLTPEQLREIFLAIATEAGETLVDQMRRDSVE